jgi:hypothetical protein
MMTPRILIAAALTAAVVVVGCGGDDEGGSQPTAAAVTTAPAAGGVSTTAASATTKAPATTMAPGTTKAAASTLSEFCAKGGPGLAQANGLSSGAAAASPAELRKQFEQLAPVLADLPKVAPAELKADVELVSKALGTIVTALAKVNYDVTKMVTDPAAMQSMQAVSDPAFAKASQNIQVWVTKNCPAGSGY